MIAKNSRFKAVARAVRLVVLAFALVVFFDCAQARQQDPQPADRDCGSPASAQQYAERRGRIVDLEVRRPFPKLDQPRNTDLYDLSRLNRALALFASKDPEDKRAEANEELADVLALLKTQALFRNRSRQNGLDAIKDEQFHFEISQFLFRIHAMYGREGATRRGWLSPENEARIAAVFSDWARGECRLADASPTHVWDVWGSENHGAQRDASCWAAAMLANGAAATYADGSTAAQQLQAWTGYLKAVISARAKAGAPIEYFSPTYSQYLLLNFYLYADFAADPELRRLAANYLTLWWALWAQEQVDGVHGGSKTRNYARVIPEGTPMPTMAWVYFGLGPEPRSLGPGEALALASDWRPAPVVCDIATDKMGRGEYDVVTQAPGLASRPMSKDGVYHVDSTQNAIVRETHATPDYAMGLAEIPDLPAERWTAISSQNRWAGLVMAGGDPAARIAPVLYSPADSKVYDGLSGVMRGGAMLVRSLLPPNDKSQASMRVWFGKPLRLSEKDGWIFAEGTAYAAVRPSSGGWRWDSEEPAWMIPDDPHAAIVIQAASRADFPDLAAFEDAIRRRAPKVEKGRVVYAPLGGAGEIDLATQSSGTTQTPGPEGRHPQVVFRSPFVNTDASGDVVITKAKHRLALCFASKCELGRQ
jgi:hypothetical protein